MEQKKKTPMLYWCVEHGKKKTRDIEVAKEISQKTGVPAINYISFDVRDLAIKAYPELNSA